MAKSKADSKSDAEAQARDEAKADAKAEAQADARADARADAKARNAEVVLLTEEPKKTEDQAAKAPVKTAGVGDKTYLCYCQICGTGCKDKTTPDIACPYTKDQLAAFSCYCQICGTPTKDGKAGITCPYK